MNPDPATAYAAHASPAFNLWLHERVQEIGEAVQGLLGDNLAGLVLAGGYGRAEGGVLERDGRELPYNDLDFVLVVRWPGKVPAGELAALGHRFGEALGIEVDFSRPVAVDALPSLPHRLLWHELWPVHLVVRGPADLLASHPPPWLGRPVPLLEATRLLLNRGAGLLWALRVVRGVEPAPDPDFARRNLWKAVQAAGDALLMAAGGHEILYVRRPEAFRRALGERPEWRDLADHYEQALEFKLRPGALSAEAPGEAALRTTAATWGRVLLEVERTRLGAPWPDLAAYAAWTGVREPAENGVRQWPRNLVRNLRLGRMSLRYPREGLYREIPGLLGLAPGPSEADWPGRSERFLAAWRGVA